MPKVIVRFPEATKTRVRHSNAQTILLDEHGCLKILGDGDKLIKHYHPSEYKSFDVETVGEN